MLRQSTAFQAPYAGDAHIEFREYLYRCRDAYVAKPNEYSSPCVVLMQSSGFGKSRLLYELAKTCAAGTASTSSTTSVGANDQFEGGMRVLYVNARENNNRRRSMAFPTATRALKNWLFSGGMANRLVTAFEYAEARWGDVGDQWLQLFDDSDADDEVYEAFKASHRKTAAERRTTNPQLSSSDRMNTTASENASAVGRTKLLVLVIDEARSLTEDECQSIRLSLDFAQGRIGSSRGHIFGVLVDTHSREPLIKTNFATGKDSSSRTSGYDSSLMSFPPFVLTHTMDVQLGASGSFDYKASVMETNPATVWNTLLSMGRPLWKTGIKDTYHFSSQQREALNLAAYKLLFNTPTDTVENYKDDTLCGVAAVLCRLEVRPHASSELSPQLVSNFMAVLGYVSHGYDEQISSYPSEPILAFGATRLWHELFLPTRMLPRFRQLLGQGALVVRSIGGVVARIILLLAMDACVMYTRTDYGGNKYNYRFAGQFCSVKQFLHTLAGDSPELHNKVDTEAVTDTQRSEFDSWMGKWALWNVSFSQFVELRKIPQEETLWYLLGRRAAGVLPCDQDGADLIIPVFRDDAVSFMLIKVKNTDDTDRNFSASATRELTPSRVFGRPHALSKTPPQNMIRVYMSLREPFDAPTSANPQDDDSARRARHSTQSSESMTTAESKSEDAPPSKKMNYLQPRYFIVDKTDPTSDSYALVLRGMCYTTETPPDLSKMLWPYLSPEVMNELMLIASEVWQDLMDQVQRDLSTQNANWHGLFTDLLSEADVKANAARVLALGDDSAGNAE